MIVATVALRPEPFFSYRLTEMSTMWPRARHTNRVDHTISCTLITPIPASQVCWYRAIEQAVMVPGLSPQAASKRIKLMIFVAFQRQTYKWGFIDPFPPPLIKSIWWAFSFRVSNAGKTSTATTQIISRSGVFLTHQLIQQALSLNTVIQRKSKNDKNGPRRKRLLLPKRQKREHEKNFDLYHIHMRFGDNHDGIVETLSYILKNVVIYIMNAIGVVMLLSSNAISIERQFGLNGEISGGRCK